MKTKMRLLFTLLFTTLSSFAMAYDFVVDDIYYNITSDSTCEVSYLTNKFNGTGTYFGDVVIPSCVTHDNKGYSVTGIGEGAFQSSKSLLSVELPQTITYFGKSAFSYCENLSYINIPESVSIIGGDAFFHCIKLNSISLPNSVIEIGSSAFWGCNKVTALKLGSGLEIIGEHAFDGLNLTELVLPENINNIGECSFSRSVKNLKHLVIPASIASIGKWAFGGGNFESIKIMCDDPYSISVYDNYFPNYDATLYVPECSAYLYRTAKVWRNFANIEEFTPSAINAVMPNPNPGLSAPSYNLSGLKVPDTTKGIVIQSGKKFFNK